MHTLKELKQMAKDLNVGTLEYTYNIPVKASNSKSRVKLSVIHGEFICNTKNLKQTMTIGTFKVIVEDMMANVKPKWLGV